MIGIKTLREELRLDIEDFGENKGLQRNIRMYNDTLTDWVSQKNFPFFLHNRHINQGFDGA